MSMEEKPMPKALMTPGREDLSPWPPIGQLKFDQITAMDEETLDRTFEERHGLSRIFSRDSYEGGRQTKGEMEGRRLEIKRAVLALCEGYLVGGPQFGDWYSSMKSGADPVDSLKGTLSGVLSNECKKRIEEVRSTVARESAIHAPTVDTRKVIGDINETLRIHGAQPMNLEDILDIKKLPPHASNLSTEAKFDIDNTLRLFLMELQGFSTEEIAKRFGSSPTSIRSTKTRLLSRRAKQAIQRIRGWKVRE